MNLSMLPSNKPQIQRLNTFLEEDWELLGKVFPAAQFRRCITGSLVHNYCNWLRQQGIVDHETREASGIDITYFLAVKTNEHPTSPSSTDLTGK